MLADKKLSTLQMMYFGARYIFNMYWYSEQSHVICVPAAHVKALRESALADLEAEAAATAPQGDPSDKKEEKKKPFVSEGDVISAWVTRLMIQHTLRPTSNKTIMIMNAYGLRWLLADDLLPAGKAYIGNAVNGVYAYLRARDLIGWPLGRSAAEVRRSIAEQGTRAQMEARRALDRHVLEKTGHPAMYGDGGMHMVVISNWTKARFFDTDFSAAVVAVANGGATADNNHEGGKRRRVGRPSYIHTGGFIQGFATRGAVPIIGKDSEGNYWVQPTVESGVWDKIRKTLEEGP